MSLGKKLRESGEVWSTSKHNLDPLSPEESKARHQRLLDRVHLRIENLTKSLQTSIRQGTQGVDALAERLLEPASVQVQVCLSQPAVVRVERPMKVLVCGARDWSDRKIIERELKIFPPGTIVIHGSCRGADNIAGAVAKSLGFIVTSYPAEWSKLGVAAGPARNRKMLEECPDIVLAFHPDLSRSKGTKDLVRVATLCGFQVKLVVV